LAVAVKVADVDPAGTTTWEGTASALDGDAEIETVTPPVGAAAVSVTVNVAVPPEFRVGWLLVRDCTPTVPAGNTRIVAVALPL
jgi:hypothetical protein